MSPIVIMESLSLKYGWTPDQIRSMRISDIQAYVDIDTMREDLRKKNNMKNNGVL